jgi:hypothetical protein
MSDGEAPPFGISSRHVAFQRKSIASVTDVK